MKINKHIKGFIFKEYVAEDVSPFDKLFEIFQELITHTSRDFEETMSWMKELDKEYNLTDENYTLEDFVEDLKKKGYIKEEIVPNGKGKTSLTAKTEQAIRKKALDQIFGKIKKTGRGNHKSKKIGFGDEITGDFRQYQFGDPIENISITETIKNAQINNGIGNFNINENDNT